MDKRNVKRVLVMLDYGPGDPQSGEVFDLTALVTEAAAKSEHQRASIQLEVGSSANYDAPREEHGWPIKLEIEWTASINFQTSARAGHLDDAINSALPDSFATQDLRKKLKRIHTKAEQINADILTQRLRDAAAIRYQHPIARVTEHPVQQIPESKGQP